MLCPLSKKRTQVVFGRGNPDARLMFIGEGPGKNEDLEGKPFVGRSGKLLTKIYSELGIKEEEIYITNIVKCRPPNNRIPSQKEITTCTKILLLEEIYIIQPTIICVLGTSAAQTLLQTSEPISLLRNNMITFNHSQIQATYHPAYVLRNQKTYSLLKEDIFNAYISSKTNRNNNKK